MSSMVRASSVDKSNTCSLCRECFGTMQMVRSAVQVASLLLLILRSSDRPSRERLDAAHLAQPFLEPFPGAFPLASSCFSNLAYFFMVLFCMYFALPFRLVCFSSLVKSDNYLLYYYNLYNYNNIMIIKIVVIIQDGVGHLVDQQPVISNLLLY